MTRAAARRRPTLLMCAAGVALVLLSSGRGCGGTRPALVWNATASVPVGLYRVLPLAGDPRVGDLVLARVPDALATLLAERGYLPFGVPLLKRVAAVAGQRVCERAGVVSIGGRVVATALANDGRGRPLPRLEGCSVLGRGEVFLLNAGVPASLDGRYFGSTPVASIIGRAVPLWTRRDCAPAINSRSHATTRGSQQSQASHHASARARVIAGSIAQHFPSRPAAHGHGPCQCAGEQTSRTAPDRDAP